MLEHIIFDMDGVLADTEPLWVESRIILLKRRGIDNVKWDLRMAGLTQPEAIKHMKKKYNLDDKVEDLINERVSILMDIFNKELKFDKNIPKILSELSKKYKLSLVSASPPMVINYILDKSDIRKYFSFIISCEHVGKGKPAPDGYLYAMKKLGITPTDCIVVEDSAMGTLSAKAAGIRVIGLNSELLDKKKADFVIDSLSELPNVLEGI